MREGYDDGGYSGGNLDRPGLRNLLEDKVLDLDDFADSGCIVNFGQIYIARTDRSSLECFQGGKGHDHQWGHERL